jgi:ribosomal protein S18 acetylase RimI-like enzyme
VSEHAHGLEYAKGLSASALQAIAELERRTIAADGGRLKLEWTSLRSRPTDQVNDLLWWDGGELRGFIGIYCFDGRNAELAGMVDPYFRRNGIGSHLLDRANALCKERSYADVLLVVPRPSVGGKHLALQRGARLDHSEHALVLESPAALGAEGPGLQGQSHNVSMRTAGQADAWSLSELLAAGFGTSTEAVEDRLAEPQSTTLVVEKGSQVIGTLRVSRDGATASVHGFVIAPSLQGRGIGRSVLRQTCLQLFAEGAERVTLEVATDNEHALGLYRRSVSSR